MNHTQTAPTRETNALRPEAATGEAPSRQPFACRLKRPAGVRLPALLLLIALFAVAPAEATELPALSPLLMEGARHYQEGRFQQAREAFLKARQAGLNNADLCYNLGNASFRLGQRGEAMLEYERALWLDPGHVDARFNRDYLRHFLADKIPEPEPSPLERFWAGLRATLGLNGLSWLLLACFTLTGVAAGLFCRHRLGPARKWWLATLCVSLVLTLAVGGVFWAMVSQQENTRVGVVLAGTLDVRSGPSTTNPVLFTVHEGLPVEVVGDARGWLQVVLPNGWNGWAPAEALGIVQEQPLQPPLAHR